MHATYVPPLQEEIIELQPALARFARRFCGTPTDVEDLVQETTMRALANLDKFHEGTHLKSWMFTIMRNTFCTKHHVSKRERIGLDDLDYRQAVQPHQEWSLRGRELEVAVACLPPHYRSAFDLVIIEGTSYEDAAQRCGCAIGTVKSRVARARQHLAERLGPIT